MSKNFAIILVFIVIGVGGYLYLADRPGSVAQDNATMVKDESVKAQTEESVVTNNGDASEGQYLPFTPNVLAKYKSTKRILYFYASWCSTCVPANADFEKNVSMLPNGVTLIRVNYSDGDTDAEEKALATKYGITYQHTFVQIDEKGNEITKWNGGAIKELLAKIK